MNVVFVRSTLQCRLGASFLAALLAASAVAPAVAGEGRARARAAMVRQAPPAVRGARVDRAAAARAPQPREPAAAPQAMQQTLPQPTPQPSETPQADRGRPGRLTPDERRALRQQINDAGRDIYRAPRP